MHLKKVCFQLEYQTTKYIRGLSTFKLDKLTFYITWVNPMGLVISLDCLAIRLSCNDFLNIVYCFALIS